MILNITSGEVFNFYISEIKEGIYIPFCESMIEGETVYPIFSENFITIRSSVHNVTSKFYVSKLGELLNEDYIKSFDEIYLWFGYDSFCQINMITVLAYLEQIKYSGVIYHMAIDDETNEVLDKIKIKETGFMDIYLNVLINKKPYLACNNYFNKAIIDYLSLYNGTDIVSKYVISNIDKSEFELLIPCLKMTREIGLGDTQILNIIRKLKSN